MEKTLSRQDDARQDRILRLIKCVKYIHQCMHNAIHLYDAHFNFNTYKDKQIPFIIGFSRTVLGDLIFIFSQLSNSDKKLNVRRLEDYIENVFDGISYCYIYLVRYVNDNMNDGNTDKDALACLKKYITLLERIADAAVVYMDSGEDKRKTQVQIDNIQHEFKSDIIQ